MINLKVLRKLTINPGAVACLKNLILSLEGISGNDRILVKEELVR